MARSIGCNIVKIHLKEATKNDRINICKDYFEMVQNGTIIIDKLFETIYYFPESFSNQEVQAHMKNNSCRICPSLQKCIWSLNQQKRNVVLTDSKCAYVTDKTDSLVQILQDLSKEYGTSFDFEYDAVKNCMKENNTSKNGVKDVASSKHNETFQSIADCGNTKRESRKTMTSMRKRIKVLKPQRKIKEELDNEKYFPNLEITVALSSHPIFRTHDINPALLMAVVNSKIDPYSLCEANSSLGEIVSDCAGPDSVVPQPQPSHQIHTRNFATQIATVSNNNPTQTRRLEEFSNSESAPPSVHGAQEQHGNRQNYTSSGMISSNEGAIGGTSVPAFTVSDHIRSPQYQAYPVRLSTFTRWPSSMTQKAEQVAQAGFHYTGLQDIVRCFACDGGLKNWDPEDEPWIEHARWFPQCPFVQKIKGQEFVDLVRRMTEESDEEEDAVVHSTFQRNNPMANPPDLQQLSIENDPDEPSQLDTDAAQIVIQTGYSRSAVAIVIDVLISKGKREYTAQDIMQVILEKEDRGEFLTTDGDSKLPRIPAQCFRSIPSANEENDTENDAGDIGKILRENESMKSIVTCIKCKAQARNTLFLPCTHHCLCQDCAEKCSICPVCYKVIKQKIKTFMI